MTVTVHHGDCREVLATLPAESVHACVTDPPYGLTFMGKKWDSIDGAAFQPETWAAVLRVMKPGAHLVAFGGTRGFHRMFCAIEDAGFEVRDCFLDLFAGAPAFAAFFDSLTTAQRHAFEEMAALHSFLGALAWAYGSGFPKSHNVGDGWGTALKPAWEPICLARKPFKGTVAANVAAHGTGALNVDGCRIAFASEEDQAAAAAAAAQRLCHDAPGQVMKGLGETGFKNPRASLAPYLAKMDKGRWPANVIHDGSEEVLEAFARYDAPGQQRAVTGAERSHRTKNAYGDFGRSDGGAEPRGDSGSAARFFYSSKADASDRLGSKHPTIKPVDLMRWLVRLVTPPGGLVLDPFAGSGTTGMAAAMEGMRAVLIEREAEYVADINRRLAHMRGADAPLFTDIA